MNQSRIRSERGMTLIELSIALVVFSIVIGGSMGFLRSQSKAVSKGADQMSIVQNMRYAANVLEQDLRTAGSNVPEHQPFLIYAGADVFSFNADYANNVSNDPFAVYHDAGAPTSTVTALTFAQRITLPTTSFVYPGMTYSDAAGVNSAAETITFFFKSDTSTTRTDDFVLYRQANAAPAEVLARNMLRSSGQSFFEYQRLITPRSASAYTVIVPAASLPVTHMVIDHGSTADTGSKALIDSLRSVRVRFTVTNGLTGAAERTRTIERLIRLPNAGMVTRRTCGDEPIFGGSVNGAFVLNADGSKVARLTWTAATDESGGEKDVVRYVIWRKLLADLDWGTPFLSLPSGGAIRTYDDETVQPGNTYQYALAAEDCTPKLSPRVNSNLVVIP